MPSVLAINGLEINRPASRLILNRLSLSIDAPDQLEFTELRAALPGSFGSAARVTLTQDEVPVFTGQVVGSYVARIGRGCIDVGYRAMGLNWLANQVFITGTDGTGRLTYNMPRTDDGLYVASDAGLSVGEILTRLFNLHWADLTAAGITAFSQAELALLAVVPPDPVVLSGRLWNAALELLYTWHNTYQARISADGVIHVESALELPRYTIVLDEEPAIVESLSRDHSESYTRVVVRGGPDTQAAYITLGESLLVPRWTSGEESTWTINDFYAPRGSSDVGAITTQASSTVTLQSDDATLAWAENELAGLNAEIVAYNPAASGIEFSEARRITSHTALSAGGTYTVTVDLPWENSGYTRYSIRGQFADLALVWRAYDIAPDYVANHLVSRLSHSAPWHPSDGIVTQTTHPQANVCKDGVEIPVTFQIVPSDGVDRGYIVFDEPVVKVFGSQASLIVGGSSVDGVPDDIKCLIPYSRGALQAVAPETGYEGTAYAVDGLERTLHREYPQWLDYRDAASMATLASEVLGTVKDTVVEAQITYLDLYRYWGLGVAIDLSQADGTIGLEDINAPVRTVTIDYQSEASIYTTILSISNRLRPFAGDRLYVHPSRGYSAGYSFSGPGVLPPPADWAAAAASPELLLGGQAGEAYVPGWATADAPMGRGVRDAEYNGLVGQLEGDPKEDARRAHNEAVSDLESGSGWETSAQKRRRKQHERAVDRQVENEMGRSVVDYNQWETPPMSPSPGDE